MNLRVQKPLQHSCQLRDFAHISPGASRNATSNAVLCILISVDVNKVALDRQRVGLRFHLRVRSVFFPHRPDRYWGTRNILSNGCRWPFPEVNRPGRQAGNSSLTDQSQEYVHLYIVHIHYLTHLRVGQCLLS